MSFFSRRLKRLLPVASVLLKRGDHASYLTSAFFAWSPPKSDAPAERGTADMRDEEAFKTEIPDRLLLYYDPFSFYSQKVVMALHEKNLPFDSKIVNLIKSDQYQPWFLHLNPRGEVPVLQDTGKIIPDSARIIDYLEDNFSNGDTPRLIPMDQGPEVRQKVTHFKHLLRKAPAGNLTTGAVLNQHLLQNSKTPFFGPVRKALANAEKNGGKNLRAYAEKNPQHKEVLLKKAEAREENYEKMCVEKNFLGVLEELHGILEEVETQLAQNIRDKRDWWLCSSRFTIADIELTVLLVRISQLGLEHVFWTGGKRPHLERYYEKVTLRDSYKKTFPGTLVLLKTIFMAQAPLIIGVMAALALVVGGAIIAAKFS